MKILILSLIFYLLCFNHIFAYDYENISMIENDFDIEQAYQDGEINYNMYRQYLSIYHNKIDINSADIYQLQLLPDISYSDAKKIMEYRNINGYFDNIKQLVEMNIINGITYERIKIFIVATIPKKKIKGKMLLKTKSNPYIETKTRGYPNTYNILDLDISGIKNNLRFGAIAEGDARYRNYYQMNDNLTGGDFQYGYRINKVYIGFEDGSLLKRFYIGNFCADFGQGLTFGNSFNPSYKGLYPDQIYSEEIQAVIYSSSSAGIEISDKYTYGYTKRYMQGLGGQLIFNNFDFTGFYSQADYPATRHFLMDNGKTYNMKLEDIYSERLLGANLYYKISAQGAQGERSERSERSEWSERSETMIGSTLYISKREPKKSTNINIPDWPSDESFLVYGTNFLTGYQKFNLSGEITKVNKYGNAWYIKAGRDIGIVNISYSHLYSENDFYNPWSSLCNQLGGHTDYIEFVIKPSKKILTKFYFKQSEYISENENDIELSYDNIYGVASVDRKIYLNYNWQFSNNIIFQIDRKWSINDVYKSGDGGNMTVATSSQIRFRPANLFGVILRYKYTEEKNNSLLKHIPKDELSGRLNYDITRNMVLTSELKFVDLNLNEIGKEYRQYWIQITNRIFNKVNLTSRFMNKWQSNEDILYSTDSLSQYSNTAGSYLNRWELRLEYRL